MINKRNLIIGGAVVVIAIIGLLIAGQNKGTDGSMKDDNGAATTTASGANVTTGSVSKTPASGSKTAGISPKFTFADYTLRVGQTTSINGVAITPLAIEQDSRCAVGVQCIQAGTATVNMRFVFNNFSSTQSVTSGTEVTVYGVTGTITSVNPPKDISKEIAPSEYSFVFRVKSKA